MSNPKFKKKPVESEYDENGNKKRPPLLPTLTEPQIRIASDNKSWLLEQQKHNDYDFALFPLGDRGLNFMEKAYGVYAHRYASPIMFHDPEFKTKFMSFEGDEVFHMYAGEWDFSMKGPAKDKTSGYDGKMFEVKLAEFRQRMAQRSTKSGKMVNVSGGKK